MSIFYDRIETEDEIALKLKILPAYYLGFFGFFFLSIALPWLALILFPLWILLIFVRIVGTWKALKEVKQAMKTGSVSISGSKFSFKNPLTYIIKKAK